jgi:hypothetical protein
MLPTPPTEKEPTVFGMSQYDLVRLEMPPAVDGANRRHRFEPERSQRRRWRRSRAAR